MKIFLVSNQIRTHSDLYCKSVEAAYIYGEALSSMASVSDADALTHSLR